MGIEHLICNKLAVLFYHQEDNGLLAAVEESAVSVIAYIYIYLINILYSFNNLLKATVCSVKILLFN